MTRLKRNGYSIYYEWDGTKGCPILMLSNSLGAHRGMWAPQREALGRHFRLLLYDHPGHGNSTLRSAPGSIASYGQDALALIDALGIEHLSFCGLSLGGMVGIWLAAHAGHRFDRMVLCNTTAKIENTQLLKKRIMEIRQNGLPSIAGSVLEKWFRPEFFERSPMVIEEIKEMFLTTKTKAYAMAADVVCTLDLRPELSRIKMPTLIICGDADEATPPAWNKAIHDAIPVAEFLSLPAAHLSNIEASAGFNSGVQEFLADCKVHRPKSVRV